MGNTNAQIPNVIMLGLDAAGKTTLLYRLLHEMSSMKEEVDEEKSESSDIFQHISYGTTVGFNVEIIGPLKVTDVGGSTAMRGLWKNYYQQMKGIIFVFDSSDKSRLNLCRKLLHNILNEKKLKSVPLLIYSNKTDLSKLTDKQQIVKILKLNKIKNRDYTLEVVTAIDNDHVANLNALLRGYEWLTHKIVNIKPMGAAKTHKPTLQRAMSASRASSLLSSTTSLIRAAKVSISEEFEHIDDAIHRRGSSLGSFMEKFKHMAHHHDDCKDMEMMDDSTLLFFILGLNKSGKTTITYHLKYGHFYRVNNHQSANYDSIQFMDYNGVKVGIYECDPFRSGKLMKDNVVFKRYRDRINGIIFVMNGHEKDRFDEIKTMLRNCILLQELNEIPLLTLVNTKNESIPCISRSEIISNMNLFTLMDIEYEIEDLVCIKSVYQGITDRILETIILYLPKKKELRIRNGQDMRDCCIHFVNGFTGDGMEEGMKWMLSNAKTTYTQRMYIASNLSPRLPAKRVSKRSLEQQSLNESLNEFINDTEDLDAWNLNESVKKTQRPRNGLIGSITKPINKRFW